MVARHRLNPAANQAIRRTPRGMPPGAIAYYDFHEGSGQVLNDLSGHGNNGQLGSTSGVDANDPTWSGGGLKPDGVDDVVMLNLRVSGPAMSFVLVTDPTKSAAHQNLVDKNHAFVANNNEADLLLGMRTYTSEPGAGYYLNLKWFNGTSYSLTYNIPSRFTGPVLLGATIDATTAKLFVGPTAVAQQASNGGQRSLPSWQLFKSSVAYGEMPLYYLRVWNRALSGAEVQRAYRIIKSQMASQKGLTI